ncbi:MAG: S-4TM family putative pore-forming effector [Blastocatellales bacterium]
MNQPTTNPALNSIAENQNQEQCLDLLAAKTSIYARATKIVAAQIILAVPVGITVSALSFFYASVSKWSPLVSLIVSLVEVWRTEPREKQLKHLAARVQEAFDCFLFNLEWHETKIGDRPSHEDIAENASAYFSKRPNIAHIKDWYSPCISELPLPAARIVCQRLSVGWNVRQRQSFAYWLLILIILLIAVPVLITLFAPRPSADPWTVEKLFLTFVVPLSPAMIWAMRERIKQLDAVGSIERLRGLIEKKLDSIDRTTSNEDLERNAREFQDEIFDLRRNDPLVFEWVYKLLRDKNQKTMEEVARVIVDRIKSRLQ